LASRPTQRARRDPLYAETADVACRHAAQDAVEDGLLELPFEVALLGQQFRAQPLDVDDERLGAVDVSGPPRNQKRFIYETSVV
jgi:hypothetical protein